MCVLLICVADNLMYSLCLNEVECQLKACTGTETRQYGPEIIVIKGSYHINFDNLYTIHEKFTKTASVITSHHADIHNT